MKVSVNLLLKLLTSLSYRSRESSTDFLTANIISLKSVDEFRQNIPGRKSPVRGSGVVRIDPLHFLTGCRTRQLNQVCMSYILACFIVMLFIRDPFYVLLVFVAMCSVFWLFWLSCHYLPSDWLERLLWRSLIMAWGSSPESPGRRVCMIFLVYCIASLFYYVFVLSPAPTWYIILLIWRDIAYMCWKCR